MPVRASSALAFAVFAGASHAATACEAVSGPQLTPVLELYTSEGCSSCPPADRWLSQLKASAAQGKVVAQAFHVGYWDYIGWIDRFAAPAHTVRQRQVAADNGLRNIYTPQLVRNGRDWRDFAGAMSQRSEAALATIRIARAEGDAFDATVTPNDANARWSAYWTVTEHGHASKVKAGENAGETLQHDFVVRQYVPVGQYSGAQKLRLRAVPVDGRRERQVNLVVYDGKSGKPLQALALACS